MDILSIKQRYGIIGNSPLLDRAIDIAMQVAATDLTVLITGESGTGKEVFPKIIHQLSSRKHGSYIAVNCGAIPEGTIDSELFGHEKGSFTGAHEARKGYFEEVNGGTIFLDEVAELPLSTQVRLLRVLETGEYFKVGSSKVLKTDVRVVAATNINIPDAISKGKFREDLYYRLNTVPIIVPSLRERKDDVLLLFRKFSGDFAQKYHMPVIQLAEDAKELLMKYRWQGNVRQLKNISEQISIIESKREISKDVLEKYLPNNNFSGLPVLYKSEVGNSQAMTDRDLLYKILFDMKDDVVELKRLLGYVIEKTGISANIDAASMKVLNDKHVYNSKEDMRSSESSFLDKDHPIVINSEKIEEDFEDVQDPEVFIESLSIQDREKDLIQRALAKHNGKRKTAAMELGISERTLYRKIKAYNIDE
jgi:transcriptional regulator with PAS, ATPase and Fis domain